MRLSVLRGVSGLAGLSIAAALLAPRLVFAAAPARAYIDQRDVDRMRVAEPRALELLQQGEKEFRAGQFEKAVGLFSTAAELAPERALLFRRKCQALTELGRRDEAVRACDKALMLVGSPMDLRAAVGALMSGPPPTSEELASAELMAEKALRATPDQPWGYAARCDIAVRLGDRSLLQDCVSELQRRAPNHYETRRAEALLPPRQSTWVLVMFWSAFLGLGLFTLAHQLFGYSRRLSGKRRPSKSAAIAIFLAASLASPDTLFAADGGTPTLSAQGLGAPEEYPINDNDPVSSVPPADVPNKNPVGFGYFIMELTMRAEKALKAGDLPHATKYFLALAKAVPDNATAFSKLCDLYEKQGQRALALASCDTAVNREGVTLDDYARLVRVALSKEGSLEPVWIKKLDAVFAHLQKTENTRVAGALLQCELGVRLEDVGRLLPCTQVLNKHLPEDPRTISFGWALAIKRQDLAAAEAAIARAERAKMPDAAIASMRAATEQIQPWWVRAGKAWRKILGVVFVTLATATAALVLLRRKAVDPAPIV